MPSHQLQRYLATIAITLLACSRVVSASRKSTLAFVTDNPLSTEKGGFNSIAYRDLNTYVPPAKSHTYSRHKHPTSISEQQESSTSISSSLSYDSETSESIIDEHDDDKKDKNLVYCTTEAVMPFPPEVAYDAMADSTRQPSWSHWLKSVDILDDERSKWKMRFMGVSQTWITATRKLERPNVIEWESIKGMRNYGKVEFISEGTNRTRVRMCVGVSVPKMLVVMMGGSKGALPKIIENKMLKPMMDNFRDIVLEEDLHHSQATA